MKKLLLAVVILLLPALVHAQGIVIKSGAASDLATVDTAKNIRVSTGQSTRATYVASTSALAGATLHTLSIEASASLGFKLVQWCVGLSNATAASSVAITVNRRSTASTAGTALTAEGTGALSISKVDPASANFGGVARSDGTLGTIGPTLDQYNFQVGIIATGAGSQQWVCQRYDYEGAQLPVVLAGVANGLSISVPSLGAGSLATSISATIIAE
jgi:hypothetical protein